MIELLAPQYPIQGTVKLSGSKSISNRLLILNEVLRLELKMQNLSDSEDTKLLQKAIQQLKNNKKGKIDIGHAGTDMRFLTTFLAVTKGDWILTGSERTKQRPIGELVNALRAFGGKIDYTEKENFPPLKIRGEKLNGGSIKIDGSVSSQFISALLLIAPSFKNGLNLEISGEIVSRPYIDMTIALLEEFGVKIKQSGSNIFISKSSIVNHKPLINIESDWSSASYWYSICALAKNSKIELSTLNKKSLQADSVLPGLFQRLGVNTTFKKNSVSITNFKTEITEFEHDFTGCPDIAQTVAVTCFGLGVKATLKGLRTLRIKETDRIFALKTELEKFGAKIINTKDSIQVIGHPSNVKGITNKVSTFNDHRMAMSFAPLALIYKRLKIEHPAVVGKSYPAFWEDLKSMGFNVNLQP